MQNYSMRNVIIKANFFVLFLNFFSWLIGPTLIIMQSKDEPKSFFGGMAAVS